MRYLFLFLILAIPFKVEAKQIDIVKIAKIESNFNEEAYNKSSEAIGLCQIKPEVLKDYNKKFGVNHWVSDLYYKDFNILVATWYLEDEIPRLLRHYKKPVTRDNILTAYNMGIGSVLKGKKAVKYIKKYNNREIK